MKKYFKTNIYLTFFVGLLISITLIDYGLMPLLSQNSEIYFFNNFNTENVNRINIERANQKIEIRKENEKWLLTTANDYKADSEVISQLLETTKNLKSTEIASTNKDNFANFGIDESTSTKIKINVDNDTIIFYLGNKAKSYNSQYFRLDKGSNIYVMNQNLGNIFNTENNFYKNKEIVNVDPKIIDKIAINGIEIQDETLKSMFNPLNANGFVDENATIEKTALSPDQILEIKIILKTENEGPIIKTTEKDKAGNYIVTVSTINQTFTLNNYILDQIREIYTKQILVPTPIP